MSLGGQSAPLLFVIAFFRESQAAPPRSSPQDHRLLSAMEPPADLPLHECKAPLARGLIRFWEKSATVDGSDLSLHGISGQQFNSDAQNRARLKENCN